MADFTDSTTQTNISVYGADGAFTDVGGAVGLLVGANAERISAEGDITAMNDSMQFIGGLIGHMQEAVVSESFYQGRIITDISDETRPFGDVGGGWCGWTVGWR